MYWYHSEMFTENEQNVNQRLSLPLPLSHHPLTRVCRHLSPHKNKAQLDAEQCVSVRGT